MTDFAVEFVLENGNVPADPLVLLGLDEQDRDGTPVYTLIYDTNRSTTSLNRAPILGNDRLFDFQGRNDRVVRVRAYADDAVVLGAHRYIEVRRYDVNQMDQRDWLDATAQNTISVNELNAIAGIVPNRSSEYGGAFQSAYTSGSLDWPTSPFLPVFTYYPLSTEAACASGSQAVHGLGNPYSSNYPAPGYHIGVDFFAPDESVVFSIGSGGLVVGIGTLTPTAQFPQKGSSNWGAFQIEPLNQAIGHNIVVRYGHLFVLYGHLRSIDDGIFVGKVVNAGAPLGKIGVFGLTAHVHVEIRSFGNTIPNLGVFQVGVTRQFGFLQDATLPGAEPGNHPKRLYDIVQFFDAENSQIFNTDDGAASGLGTVSGLGAELIDGDPIEIDGNTVDCNFQFEGISGMTTVQDAYSGATIRGFIMEESSLTAPDAPSTVPPAPSS